MTYRPSFLSDHIVKSLVFFGATEDKQEFVFFLLLMHSHKIHKLINEIIKSKVEEIDEEHHVLAYDWT